MAIEKARGCGYRKVGGLYLVSGSLSAPCGKLPVPLTVCPCCNQGIKPARGWTWINPRQLFGPSECCLAIHKPGGCCRCLMAGSAPERGGLLWIGDKFYSPSSFVAEAALMGVSRRINNVPNDLIVGETVVYMAHRSAIVPACDCQGDIFEPSTETGGCPVHGLEPKPATAGIVTAFIPHAVEIIVTDVQANDADFMQGIADRGLTAVVVPHDDKDHNPKK